LVGLSPKSAGHGIGIIFCNHRKRWCPTQGKDANMYVIEISI